MLAGKREMVPDITNNNKIAFIAAGNRRLDCIYFYFQY